MPPIYLYLSISIYLRAGSFVNKKRTHFETSLSVQNITDTEELICCGSCVQNRTDKASIRTVAKTSQTPAGELCVHGCPQLNKHSLIMTRYDAPNICNAKCTCSQIPESSSAVLKVEGSPQLHFFYAVLLERGLFNSKALSITSPTRKVLYSKSNAYSVLDFIGEGCYGKVAVCKSLDTSEMVAIKILKNDPSIKQDTDKELSMLKMIRDMDADSANVVKFFEQFEHEGNICLVFEVLDCDLIYLLEERQRQPLSLDEIRVIAHQLLVALVTLKRVGILHTDIKPDNIMIVNRKEQPLKVKLIDFGNAIPASKIKLGLEIQPVGYRAPEITLGLPYNENIDVWSVGCIMAFLFLLMTPEEFEAANNEKPKNQDAYCAEGELDNRKAFLDLLKQMLHLDGHQRISASQALRHPFITMAQQPDSGSLSPVTDKEVSLDQLRIPASNDLSFRLLDVVMTTSGVILC
uniref:Homeodomain-interacting protein kinase 1-like n=1 Tax=Hippocampus comes TaxID=109280 RepID=A0A3Q2Y2B1_HIPCM